MTAALLALGMPLAGMFLLWVVARRAAAWAGWFATACWIAALGGSMWLFWQFGWQAALPQSWAIDWLRLTRGFSLSLGLRLDAAASLLLVVVTVCGTLVSLVSTSYMARDANRSRYFTLLLGFGAAMLGLVLAINLLQLLICWELVGLASYLLIGFWHQRRDAAHASLQAFLVNRAGDVLLLGGIIGLVVLTGTLDMNVLHSNLFPGWYAQLDARMYWAITCAGLAMALGAAAKSAQLPYSGWLPDAMAGPTPVSALLHAATMVAAGVIVLVRISPILTPTAQQVVAGVGVVTAVYGAIGAIAQFDLKRVLAYSTVSQLGYMVAAVGFGHPDLALFHLTTHAFFKCGLFLGAAAIIHHIHHVAPGVDPQDLRNLGGLGKNLRWIAIAFVVSTAALVGLPFTSGFASKDAILAAALIWDIGLHGTGGWLAAGLLLGVALTAGYMMRLLMLVFAGKSRNIPDQQAHLPWVFPVAVGLLAVLSLGFWFRGDWFRQAVPVDADAIAPGWQLLIGVLSLIAVGIVVAIWTHRRYRYVEQTIPMAPWRNLSYRGFYLTSFYRILSDGGKLLATAGQLVERFVLGGLLTLLTKVTATSRSNASLANLAAWLDQHLLDGLVRGTGATVVAAGTSVQRTQTGKLQQYLLLTLLVLGGFGLLILWLLLAA